MQKWQINQKIIKKYKRNNKKNMIKKILKYQFKFQKNRAHQNQYLKNRSKKYQYLIINRNNKMKVKIHFKLNKKTNLRSNNFIMIQNNLKQLD